MRKKQLALFFACLALGILLPASTQAATLTEFGYAHMTLNGHPNTNTTRGLLLLLVNYADLPPPTHTASYYQSLIFNIGLSNMQENVRGFFTENSLSRF